MKKNSVNEGRRKLVGAGVFALPLAVCFPGAARAQDLPHVDPEDTTAKALNYTEDATTVDAATRGGDDRFCHSCALFSQPDAEWGPCGIFPGKAVSRNGWCQSWVKRP